MKKLNRQHLIELYSDQIFYYLISSHEEKYHYIIRFFNGAKITLKAFGYNQFFGEILEQSVRKALSRLERPFDYYKYDVNYLIEFYS